MRAPGGAPFPPGMSQTSGMTILVRQQPFFSLLYGFYLECIILEHDCGAPRLIFSPCKDADNGARDLQSSLHAAQSFSGPEGAVRSPEEDQTPCHLCSKTSHTVL